MLKTTLNIHCDVMSKINHAAATLKISRRDIIIKLLMRIMHDVDTFQGEFTTVKYQPDDERCNWHCFSIKYYRDENEFWVDLRKLSKFSVSHLVAIAVDKYLDKLLEGDVHNYAQFYNYMLVKEIVEGIICWQCYWGIPERRKKMHKLRKHKIKYIKTS